MKEMTIAVLGLGAMGLPMASRLAERFVVRGYDLDSDRTKLAQQHGVIGADSAQDAAREANAVLLAVRNESQLVDVLYGANAVTSVLAPEAVIVVTSTVGIQAIASVSNRLEQDGFHLVDAPVSGGPTRAGAGDLLIVVGASDPAYSAVQPLLEHLASTLERMGDKPGLGQAMKTVNQLLCGVHIAAAAEALALAKSLGLDQKQVLKTLNAGAAASFMLGDRGPRMLQAYSGQEVPVRSRLDIFVKDMGIVSSAARSAQLATPVAAAAEQLYLMGLTQGGGGQDDSSIITALDPGDEGSE